MVVRNRRAIRKNTSPNRRIFGFSSSAVWVVRNVEFTHNWPTTTYDSVNNCGEMNLVLVKTSVQSTEYKIQLVFLN